MEKLDDISDTQNSKQKNIRYVFVLDLVSIEYFCL